MSECPNTHFKRTCAGTRRPLETRAKKWESQAMQASQGPPRTVIAVQVRAALAALHLVQAQPHRLPRLLPPRRTLCLLAASARSHAVSLRRQRMASKPLQRELPTTRAPTKLVGHQLEDESVRHWRHFLSFCHVPGACGLCADANVKAASLALMPAARQLTFAGAARRLLTVNGCR